MGADPDLYELNLFYLHKARDMALKGKAKSASLTMGMPQEVVNRLPELPLEKLRMLAGSGMLCFSSRLSEKFWRELLHTEMDENLLRARVLLMIAGGEGGPYGDDDGTA
ncbi:MAG: flagellar transcriptional regulator FlhD [Proteobacteria bacterium]|nr:flagellar transcriptional regulator FlhD [Pseudomonadota bacterium]